MLACACACVRVYMLMHKHTSRPNSSFVTDRSFPGVCGDKEAFEKEPLSAQGNSNQTPSE